MKRPKEDMLFGTFLQAMEWVEFFYNRGLQKELSFTGIGESTMHPQFKEMLLHARERCPKMPIVFSTNGLPDRGRGSIEQGLQTKMLKRGLIRPVMA